MGARARRVADIVAIALALPRAARAQHGQCGLQLLQSHLQDVQEECCYNEAHSVAARLEPNLLGYWQFENGPGERVITDMSDNGRDGRVEEGNPDWRDSSLAGGSHSMYFNPDRGDIARATGQGLPRGNEERTLMGWFKRGDGEENGM